MDYSVLSPNENVSFVLSSSSRGTRACVKFVDAVIREKCTIVCGEMHKCNFITLYARPAKEVTESIVDSPSRITFEFYRASQQSVPFCSTYGERLQLRVVEEVQFAVLHKLDRHGVLVQLGACHERVESLKTNGTVLDHHAK